MVDVPPPPENPFMDSPDPYANGNGGETLDQGAPNVAAKPGRVLVVLGMVGLVLILLLYSIFSGGKKEAPVAEKKEKPVAAAPLTPPPLPEAPAIPAPPPSILPPSIPAPTSLQIMKPEDNGAAKAQALERIKSKMVVSDSGGGLSNILAASKDEKKTAANSDPNSTFEANVVNANTKADKVEATRISDLRRTIAQGRIIQATTESVINTDLPAPIRAIVSLDTYGEAGTDPLIPKGSRLIGTYNTDISGGQSRVFVVWTRVIRPDGVDVMINSPLVDQIGQAGAGGQVDSKFQSVFSRTILSSIISIAFAIGSDKISGGSTTTSTSSLGSSTTGDASTTATVNALQNLGAMSDSFIQRYIDARPTILVDQGTPVNVFVNRDLIFPADVTSSTRVVN